MANIHIEIHEGWTHEEVLRWMAALFPEAPVTITYDVDGGEASAFDVVIEGIEYPGDYVAYTISESGINAVVTSDNPSDFAG